MHNLMKRIIAFMFFMLFLAGFAFMMIKGTQQKASQRDTADSQMVAPTE